MKQLLQRLHDKLGDLWWYSLMIFVACRSGDVIQAFIGLWLVPQYVGPEELGAVLPLQQLSALFAVPLAILATVFAKYVNTYATRGELGKVKSFIRDVLLASTIVFVFCIAVAYWVIPHFYIRLNVVSGMLTVLILASGFICNINSLFSSALQGLKKFRTMTVQNLISAPIRLITLLVAMPFRALSGYILGQTTPPATCSLLAALTLRKDLRAIPPDTTWRRDLPEILKTYWPYALCTVIGSFTGAVVATVYRQRLPEIESSAYYMLTRFAEIAGYIGCSISVVLFPLASEAHEKGRENTTLLRHTFIGTAALSLALAIFFHFFGAPIFSLTETWLPYQPYAPLIPVMTLSTGIGIICSAITTYELACKRMGATVLILILNTIWAAALVCFTGCEIFRGILPDVLISLMKSTRFDHLVNLTWYTFAFGIIQLISILALTRRKRHDR